VSAELSKTSTLKEQPAPLRSAITLQKMRELAIQLLLMCCALISILTTLGIIFVLLSETVFSIPFEKLFAAQSTASQSDQLGAFFQEVSLVEFLTSTRWDPRQGHFGILPLLSGTLMVAFIAAVVGIPIGLASAIYLSEYASPRVRNVVKPILEILAGIPTVVYGYFALVFITPYLLQWPLETGFGLRLDSADSFIDVHVFNAASAGIVVGIMIIPMISSLSEDVLRAVPSGLREAGFALGSTKYDVSTKIVVPAALSGIVASFLLAISRAIGETMAVTIAAGNSPNMSFNPFVGVQTMTAYIVNVITGDAVAGTIQYKSLYAVALTLFVITLVMNILSQIILRRFREVYH